MISFDALLENTNPWIRSFRMLQNTKCKKQIDDRTFIEVGVIAFTDDVYDGEIVKKQDDNIYLFLGYDSILQYDLYIPLYLDKGRIVNITEAEVEAEVEAKPK